jgi:aldose 1-epimerase
MALHTLQNEYWQAGILPQTGASVAFGRVHKDDQWIDILRPTPESDYGNSSNCSSFIMLPWCNRIKNGLLRFDDNEYQLRTTKDDGTARHGDVRGRNWRVDEADDTHIRMSLRSDDFPDMNWPFKFSAAAEYALDDQRFVWTLTLKNEDSRPMPAGFGHHPYFVRSTSQQPQVQIFCDQQFELVDYMAVAAPVPINPINDFHQLKPLDDYEFNDLLTRRTNHEEDACAHLVFPESDIGISMIAERLFEHILIYAPQGKPFFAVEPMTNASDGFNLATDSIPGSGIFVLQPGEQTSAQMILDIESED